MTTPLIDNTILHILALLILLIGIIWFLLKLVRYLSQNLSSQRSLVDQVNQLLPQTQCGHCGYAGCRPYAKAIVGGEAINKCPPASEQAIIGLANLLNETATSLDPAHGDYRPFSIAFIREQECIGCTKCIQACPVDAILGGPKLMHTVITQECTGCDLCVEPCPVDCIDMISPDEPTPWKWPLPVSLHQAKGKLESAR